MNKTIGALLASITAGMSLAHATVLFNPDFNNYATGPIVGQDGWVNNPVFLPTQLPPAQTISVSGGRASVNGSFTTGFYTTQVALHSISSTGINSGSIYYSASINFTAANNNVGNAMFLGDSIDSFNWGARLNVRSSGEGFQLGWGDTGNSTVDWGDTLEFGTTYNIVMEYNIVPGAKNDFGSLYVSTGGFDPDQSQNVAYSSGVVGSGMTEVTSFRYFGLYQNNTNGDFTIGDLKVGTAWNDVAAVPEPGATALFGVGLGAILLRRRRKIA